MNCTKCGYHTHNKSGVCYHCAPVGRVEVLTNGVINGRMRPFIMECSRHGFVTTSDGSCPVCPQDVPIDLVAELGTD